MKQLFIILMSLLVLTISAVNCYSQASYTTVTATLTDSSNQVWSNAVVIATLRPAPNNPSLPLNNGLAITDSPQTALTNNSGAFTLNLDNTSKITPAGALWTFSIYPNATVANGNSISLPITGTSVNLSGVLSSILTVPAVFAAPSVNRAYSATEVTGGVGGIYWDTTANLLKGCATVVLNMCTSWQTIGSFSVPGSHYYIPYNNGSGNFTANSNLQFNDLTNTFSTYNATFNNNVSFPNLTVQTGCLNINAGIVGSYLCQGGTPSIVAGAGAGGSPNLILVSNSLDNLGIISVYTGTSPNPTANSVIFTFTYSSSFSTLSSCVVYPNGGGIFYSGQPTILTNRLGWTLSSGSVALSPSSAYAWNYICQGY
jgi:hypothetical protein